MFSGGVGSWATAMRIAECYGTDDLVLLFADTLIEDDDLYRFLVESTGPVAGVNTSWLALLTDGLPPIDQMEARRERLDTIFGALSDVVPLLTRISDGRDPWQVFFDVRYLGNTRIDPCSKLLKRDLMRQWMLDNCDPDDTIIYIGIDWTESHRIEGARERYLPFKAEAPMCAEPYLLKTEMLSTLGEFGIEPPRLYDMGFAHNNCGGFCIKSGQAQFENLLRHRPDLYRYHERREQELRVHLDKDIAILRDRRGGTTKPMTMTMFRERLEAAMTPEDRARLFDREEWGGCGCAL